MSTLKNCTWRLLQRRPLTQEPINSSFISKRTPVPAKRAFSTTSNRRAKNQIYDPVKRVSDFDTYHLLSVSSRSPLLTLWTTSWCPTCKIVSPILYRLVESGVGEAEGGVGLCTIEYDSPDIMKEGFGHMYVISSVPTLMAFDEHGGRMSTRIMDPTQLTDETFLANWIREEARRMNNGASLTSRFFKL
ncbi:hypothetical protein jhhlp_003960 [Lomentospora prolificans]|uniref:Thioredoxin domain-containing protein n=1 Tax=Lomentospora prolificans TaxID=41688 RepID=A0A2N3NA75_9PEZI|nr:hypothetical protein jhhlp_003960 [Lomentospora prolificans]